MSVPISSSKNSLRNPSAWLGLVVLGILILGAYSNSFHGPFIFDDSSSIEENPSIHSWRTVLFPPGDSGLTVSGRPMVNVTIAINYALGGMNVVGYHVMNVCIHVLAAFALFGLVRRTLMLPVFRDKYGAHSWWLALAAAGVWGLHPLQTESVTYFVQRAESLAGLFYLLTMYLFVRSVEQPESLRYKVGTVIACVFGMASKEVMVTVPVVIFLYDWIFVAGSFSATWQARRKLYFVLAATWIVLAACIISTGKRGSTVGFSAEVDAWRYTLTQCYAILHYLRLVFWPNPLVLDYGGPLANKFSEVAWRALALCLLAGGSVYLFWRKPKVGFFLVTFFILLAPTSSFVPVLTQTVAEHRMYLPVAPLVVLLVVGTGMMWANRFIFLWLLIGLALGVRTYVRNHDYRSAEAIWTTVTDNCAYNIRGWNSLAMIHSQNGNYEKAKAAMEVALRVRPDDSGVFTTYANILSKLNKNTEAEKYYLKALKLDPTSFEANYNLGILFLENGRAGDAVAHFEIAIKQDPKANIAHYNLGKAYVAMQRLEDAVSEFQGILKRDPKAPDVRNNLGNALLSMNRTAEAIPILEEGLKLVPQSNELHRTLGLALLSMGKVEDAIGHLETAVKLNAKDAKALANLGLALQSVGRGEDAYSRFAAALAIPDGLDKEMARAVNVSAADESLKLGKVDRAKTHYEQAVALDPTNLQLRYVMANLLLRTGSYDEAIRQYGYIIGADPSFADAQEEIGVGYMETGQLVEARVHLEAARRLQPENTTYQENLARLNGMVQR